MEEKTKTFLNHERYQLITIVLALLFTIWIFSCESTVPSLSSPSRRVTRNELQDELSFVIAQAETRFKKLDRQDELKQLITDSALLFAQGGTINPIGLLTANAALLGVGAAVDNVRRRKKEKAATKTYVDDAHKT